ncbi:hypothetical protein [Kitasatospora sp. NPDC001683]
MYDLAHPYDVMPPGTWTYCITPADQCEPIYSGTLTTHAPVLVRTVAGRVAERHGIDVADVTELTLRPTA